MTEKEKEKEKESWKRYAREGYVKACDAANHKFALRATKYLEDRIKKLEKRVAIHERIATLVSAIVLSLLMSWFLSRLQKHPTFFEGHR